MASTLPFAAHGDILPVVKFETAYEGKDAARHEVGVKVTALLLFDNCAAVPIVIKGFDFTQMPTGELVTARNMKLQLLVAKFSNLVITFTGGDFGAIRYKGTASGIEILNLNSAASPGK